MLAVFVVVMPVTLAMVMVVVTACKSQTHHHKKCSKCFHICLSINQCGQMIRHSSHNKNP